MGLGRLELPTSRLSDISQALVGAGDRWNQGDLADLALVSASQRWWAMIQVLLQLSQPLSVTTTLIQAAVSFVSSSAYFTSTRPQVRHTTSFVRQA